MSAYSKTRDQRIADEVNDAPDRALMCSAHGCPNRWSVDNHNGRCCTAHAWEDERNRWPEITQRQQWDEADRARDPKLPESAVHLSAEQKRAILKRLQATAAAMGGRASENVTGDRA